MAWECTYTTLTHRNDGSQARIDILTDAEHIVDSKVFHPIMAAAFDAQGRPLFEIVAHWVSRPDLSQAYLHVQEEAIRRVWQNDWAEGSRYSFGGGAMLVPGILS